MGNGSTNYLSQLKLFKRQNNNIKIPRWRYISIVTLSIYQHDKKLLSILSNLQTSIFRLGKLNNGPTYSWASALSMVPNITKTASHKAR